MSHRTLASLTALTLVLFTLSGRAQNLDPVDRYLKSAEDSANNVVNQAGAQGRGVAMEAAQALLLAIANFRAAYADSLQKTDAALSGQQAELFQNIRLSAAQLDLYRSNATTSLEGIADKLNAATRSLPFSSNFPMVTRISPLFVAENKISATELVVKGVSLAIKAPILWINGQPVHPSTTTDSELRFPMPSKNGTFNGRAFAGGVLQVFERKGMIFSSYAPKNYPVRVALYPTAIGTYRILPRYRATEPDKQTRTSSPVRCESPQGSGSSSVPVSVTARSGWAIDTSTIRWVSSYSNHGRTTLNSQNETGFTASVSCDGYGRVEAMFTIDAGSKGVESGSYEYVEHTTVNPIKDGTALTGTMNWGQTITETLPSNTETTVVTLKPDNGDVESVEGAGDAQHFSVMLNRLSKVLSITPKDIESVLRR